MLCLPRNMRVEVHKVLRLSRALRVELHKVLYLPRNLRVEIHKVLCLRRNRRVEVRKVLYLLRNLQTSRMSKSNDSLHLSRNVQSAAPATKAAVRSETAPIPCTCYEKSTFNHENMMCLPRKVITMCNNAHGTATRAQSLEAPAADTQIQRACAVEMRVDDFERHACTVNSSELAGHARALQRPKRQLLFYYRKNPLVCSHCLGKKLVFVAGLLY